MKIKKKREIKPKIKIKLKHKQIIIIYDAFECLNKNKVFLGLNKCIKCENFIIHKILKYILDITDKLIIFLLWGKIVNKMIIDFGKKLNFSNSQV